MSTCQVEGCTLSGDPSGHVHFAPPSTPAETPANSQTPPVIEGPGRYVVYQAPDGGWVVARATDICETCKGCGCGEQAEPIQIPGMVIAIAKQRGGGGNLLGMLKAAAGRR